MKEKNKLEEAKKLIEAEKKKKLEECGKKLAELLKEYNAELLVMPHITIEGKRQEILIQIKEAEKA